MILVFAPSVPCPISLDVILSRRHDSQGSSLEFQEASSKQYFIIPSPSLEYISYNINIFYYISDVVSPISWHPLVKKTNLQPASSIDISHFVYTVGTLGDSSGFSLKHEESCLHCWESERSTLTPTDATIQSKWCLNLQYVKAGWMEFANSIAEDLCARTKSKRDCPESTADGTCALET
jgi:hypothetical protein